jgi:hypothetical protein
MMVSSKQQALIDMYSVMAKDGYATADQGRVEVAFSDMEVRAFKDLVKPLLTRYGVKSLLDFGCGGSDYLEAGFSEDQNAKTFFELDEVRLFEPARNIDQRQPSDAVLCFDVLEHIFIADVPRIVRELFSFAGKLLVVNVACYPARALLPNGENAHITVRPPLWWKGIFDAIAIEFPDVSVQLWCSVGWRNAQGYPVFRARDWSDQEGFVVPM